MGKEKILANLFNVVDSSAVKRIKAPKNVQAAPNRYIKNTIRESNVKQYCKNNPKGIIHNPKPTKCTPFISMTLKIILIKHLKLTLTWSTYISLTTLFEQAADTFT